MFYKKLMIVLLIFSLLFVSCVPQKKMQKGDAQTVLEDILVQFGLENGALYSEKNDAQYRLTDALLARMFNHTGDLADFAYVDSAAVWFSRRFNEKEIVVLRLCDLSHQRELLRLLTERAQKKENAVAFANGIYVYLICTDKNEEIMRYLQ
ncbi:MAG: hypothetical protein IJ489_10510 [Clostridia bacterium]|nr:hypothetical protein [Clostridia bacterium]